MDKGFKLTKNTFSLIAREALNKGVLFVLLILVGRFLGKEALGRYSLAFAVSYIFFFGMELGLNTLLIREVAKDRFLASKFLVNVVIVRIASGVLTMGLIWLTVLVLGARGEAAAIIYLCGISYFFVNITNVYTSIFRAFEKMELDTAVAFFRNLIFFPSAVILLFNKAALVSIFNVFLFANIISLVIANFIFLRWIRVSPRGRFSLDFCREQLAQTAPLWLSQLFGIAYLRIAPLLLFRIKGAAAVGMYNAGFVVLDGFWIAASCFVYSLFPIISRLEKAQVRKEYLRGLRFIALFFLALAFIVILGSRNLVLLFFGEKFIGVVPLFRLFAIVAIFVAVDMHSGMVIIAIGKQFFLPFINVIGLIANFCLNIVFIQRFSYIGPAYVLMISEFLVFGLMMIVLNKFLLRKEKVRGC